EVRAAAGHVDLADLALAARREIEVEGPLDLTRERVARLRDDVVDLLGDDLRRPAAALVGFGLLVRDVALFPYLLGDRLAGVGDLAREGGDAPRDDVQGRDGRADVQERDRAVLRQPELLLEDVLDG